MMLKLPADFLFKKLYLTVFLILIAACSTPSETETPESPTEAVQETTTSVPAEATPIPSRETIPEGLIPTDAP